MEGGLNIGDTQKSIQELTDMIAKYKTIMNTFKPDTDLYRKAKRGIVWCKLEIIKAEKGK